MPLFNKTMTQQQHTLQPQQQQQMQTFDARDIIKDVRIKNVEVEVIIERPILAGLVESHLQSHPFPQPNKLNMQPLFTQNYQIPTQHQRTYQIPSGTLQRTTNTQNIHSYPASTVVNHNQQSQQSYANPTYVPPTYQPPTYIQQTYQNKPQNLPSYIPTNQIKTHTQPISSEEVSPGGTRTSLASNEPLKQLLRTRQQIQEVAKPKEKIFKIDQQRLDVKEVLRREEKQKSSSSSREKKHIAQAKDKLIMQRHEMKEGMKAPIPTGPVVQKKYENKPNIRDKLDDQYEAKVVAPEKFYEKHDRQDIRYNRESEQQKQHEQRRIHNEAFIDKPDFDQRQRFGIIEKPLDIEHMRRGQEPRGKHAIKDKVAHIVIIQETVEFKNQIPEKKKILTDSERRQEVIRSEGQKSQLKTDQERRYEMKPKVVQIIKEPVVERRSEPLSETDFRQEMRRKAEQNRISQLSLDQQFRQDAPDLERNQQLEADQERRHDNKPQTIQERRYKIYEQERRKKMSDQFEKERIQQFEPLVQVRPQQPQPGQKPNQEIKQHEQERKQEIKTQKLQQRQELYGQNEQEQEMKASPEQQRRFEITPTELERQQNKSEQEMIKQTPQAPQEQRSQGEQELHHSKQQQKFTQPPRASDQGFQEQRNIQNKQFVQEKLPYQYLPPKKEEYIQQNMQLPGYGLIHRREIFSNQLPTRPPQYQFSSGYVPEKDWQQHLPRSGYYNQNNIQLLEKELLGGHQIPQSRDIQFHKDEVPRQKAVYVRDLIEDVKIQEKILRMDDYGIMKDFKQEGDERQFREDKLLVDQQPPSQSQVSPQQEQHINEPHVSHHIPNDPLYYQSGILPGSKFTHTHEFKAQNQDLAPFFEEPQGQQNEGNQSLGQQQQSVLIGSEKIEIHPQPNLGEKHHPPKLGGLHQPIMVGHPITSKLNQANTSDQNKQSFKEEKQEREVPKEGLIGKAKNVISEIKSSIVAGIETTKANYFEKREQTADKQADWYRGKSQESQIKARETRQKIAEEKLHQGEASVDDEVKKAEEYKRLSQQAEEKALMFKSKAEEARNKAGEVYVTIPVKKSSGQQEYKDEETDQQDNQGQQAHQVDDVNEIKESQQQEDHAHSSEEQDNVPIYVEQKDIIRKEDIIENAREEKDIRQEKQERDMGDKIEANMQQTGEQAQARNMYESQQRSQQPYLDVYRDDE